MNEPMRILNNTDKAGGQMETLVKGGKVALRGKRFHFIGAGGVGMSGLAKVLLRYEAEVTGSDQMHSEVIEGLCEKGAQIKIGHNAENIYRHIDAVVISAAVKEDNPELKHARQRGIKVYKYAQMLGELAGLHEPIAIAGTHGKSTTTAWLAYLLQSRNFEPNFIVGAEVPQLGCSSGTGEGRHFIAEACEYDRSFLNIKPQVACILNIEQDHLDYYRDVEEITEAFCAFAGGIRGGGTLIANGEDEHVKEVVRVLSGRVQCETFGLGVDCDFTARNARLVDGCYSFEICRKGEVLGTADIQLPGRHNILNALAVTALALKAGLSEEDVIALLGDFTGIERRLMLKAKIHGVTVVDDYAHHPTEIRGSLQALREQYQPNRLLCVFQPHQYSRTRFLLDDFAESFKLADITIVPQIYFVRDTQKMRKEVNSQILVERITGSGCRALFIDGFEKIGRYLKDNLVSGDLVVTMGAGDIWKVADEFIHRSGANS